VGNREKRPPGFLPEGLERRAEKEEEKQQLHRPSEGV